MLNNKKFSLIISFLGLYLMTTGVSWAGLSFLNKEPELNGNTSNNTAGSRIDPNLPKTESCPVNGKMYSKPERDIWETRRPIAAMIENHADARPESGLSYADIIYETVAEGGITRFLSVFYCGASAQDVKISPIRSARVYYVDWASEYKNPVFVHVGGANNICSNCPGGVKPAGQVAREADAFKMLDKLGWRGSKGNAFDGGTNVGYPIVIRDQYRLETKSAWEHSVVGFTDKIFDEAEKRGYGYKDDKGNPWNKNYIPWKFADEKPSSSPTAVKISFEFWSNKPDYDVSWDWDKATSSYLRNNGGKSHIDHETGKQLTAKNVVIQFLAEKGPVDKEGHMFYTTVGKGDAIIFKNGEAVKGTWEKSASGRTKFFDVKGAEVEFVKGVVWIEGVPAGNKVSY